MTAQPPPGHRIIHIDGLRWHLPRATYNRVVSEVTERGTVVDADVERFTADMYEWETGIPADRSSLFEHDAVLDYLVTAELDWK
jgi:hypothetical protein